LIERSSSTVIPAGHILRPLKDYIVLKPLDWKPSEIIDVIRLGRPLRGLVKAIGPGKYPKIYKRNEQGQKESFRYSKTFRKTEVEPGATVELGGLNIFDGEGYSFPEVLIDNEIHLIVQEDDVVGVC
jgi:hypothetical protein